ncbi:uncharacterized protein [Rutidosis leptorrhynchoides]|uniref:uncharacterized protein n=1 Tax=Rutidosis leptorrhynchoides TaxID=125765 RepID=UPI003A98E239
MYRRATDFFEQNNEPNFKIKLIARRSGDGRNYNFPTVDEVAALIVGDIDLNFDKRDIIVDSLKEGLQHISELHPQYLALQYPLLFAHAEDGYRLDIYHRDVDENTRRLKKHVTMREFLLISYKKENLQLLSIYHASYINNCWLMLTPWSNLKECITSGKNKTYLEPTLLQTLLKRLSPSYGYPDLFITFTCNSKWPEIRRALEGTGFNPEDKPAYQARMFKIKFDRLMEAIKNSLFGRVKADLYTIEFQKRGLPHAHICIFLDERDKLPKLEDVDKFISAEIPDKDADLELYQLVSDLMIHDCTTVDKEDYPIFKCRDNDGKVRKYLFKYINKDNDRVTAGVCDEVTDEIKEYYDCRYVSSCEPVWRMLSFDIHNRNPIVIRLAFHLPDQHSVIFDEDDLIENLLDSESVNRSQFLEWMNMNRANEDARHLSYLYFPTKFVWNKETKLWSPRKVFTDTIGRIHHVSLQTGELFYLGILLNKVKGLTSYEDIQTVNGQLCPTFKDACYEMGLLDDDQEYINGIKEADSWGGGHFVWNLFCQLLKSESLSRPKVVFDEAFEYLSIDIIHHRLSDIQPTHEMLKNLT